jgi:hypothetical protein
LHHPPAAGSPARPPGAPDWRTCRFTTSETLSQRGPRPVLFSRPLRPLVARAPDLMVARRQSSLVFRSAERQRWMSRRRSDCDAGTASACQSPTVTGQRSEIDDMPIDSRPKRETVFTVSFCVRRS